MWPTYVVSMKTMALPLAKNVVNDKVYCEHFVKNKYNLVIIMATAYIHRCFRFLVCVDAAK